MIIFVPASVTFPPGDKSPAIVVANYGSTYDQNTQIINNTCSIGSKPIATITQGFDYGFWSIAPGPTNGTCNFTIQDKTIFVMGTEYITNSSN